MTNVLKGNFRKNYFNVKLSENSLNIISNIEEKIKDGARHLAISSTGYSSAQQKLALQVVYWLNQKYPEHKVAVVTFDYGSGVFKEFYDHSVGDSRSKKFYNHFTMVNWTYVTSPEALLDDYDVIIWNLPDISTLKSHHQRWDHFFMSLDMLTIISCQKAGSKQAEFEKNVVRTFMDYGLDISKLIDCRPEAHSSVVDRLGRFLSRRAA